MTAPQILAEVRARGVELAAVGDRLRYRPVTAVPPELLEELRQNKPELLRLLAAAREIAAPAACGWCGGPLAAYLLDSGSKPALLCPSCRTWTFAGGVT